MAKIPGMLLSAKGYWFVRWTDPVTGRRREKTLATGNDKSKAERQYKDWLREYLQIAHPAQPAKSSQSAKSPQPSRSAMSHSINDLVLAFIKEYQNQYVENSFGCHKKACELLSEMYGGCAIASFRIPQFKQLIERMIEKKWALRTINQRIGVIKKVFHYALEHDLIDGDQYGRIQSVSRVRSDDRRVKPAKKILPVPVDVVKRALPYFRPIVADILQVQLGGAMRAGEVCRMRFDELGWGDKGALHYRPVKHKNASRGKKRDIILGPKAQKILATYGVTPEVIESGDFPREYVFDPRKFIRAQRNSHPYFLTQCYCREVKAGREAAVAAGVIKESELWASHQLRHRKLTDTRRDYGPDEAQLVAGHSDIRTTQRYAEPDMSKAVRAVMDSDDTDDDGDESPCDPSGGNDDER